MIESHFIMYVMVAIDFMLNRSFAESTVAMNCLNKTLENHNNHDAHVTIHLRGSEEFCLNVSIHALDHQYIIFSVQIPNT